MILIVASPVVVLDVCILTNRILAAELAQLVDHNDARDHLLDNELIADQVHTANEFFPINDFADLKTLPPKFIDQYGVHLGAQRNSFGFGVSEFFVFSASRRTSSGPSHILILPGLDVSHTTLYRVRQ